jgi:hypothetical protein
MILYNVLYCILILTTDYVRIYVTFDSFYISWPYMVPAVDHMNKSINNDFTVGLISKTLQIIIC